MQFAFALHGQRHTAAFRASDSGAAGVAAPSREGADERLLARCLAAIDEELDYFTALRAHLSARLADGDSPDRAMRAAAEFMQEALKSSAAGPLAMLVSFVLLDRIETRGGHFEVRDVFVAPNLDQGTTRTSQLVVNMSAEQATLAEEIIEGLNSLAELMAKVGQVARRCGIP